MYEVSAYLRQYGTRALKTAGGALLLLGLLSVSAYLSAYETHALTYSDQRSRSRRLPEIIHMHMYTHIHTHIHIHIDQRT